MKPGTSNIVSAIHALRQAYDHFEDFQREMPGTKGASLMKNYNNRLEWIVKDLRMQPSMEDWVRDGLKKEWESDVFSVPAIAEQVALLTPEQRALVEEIIEAMLNGEDIKVNDL